MFRASAPARSAVPDSDGGAEPLWRELLGRGVRRRRLDAGRTLGEVAGRAGISPQYLSEIERGLKEPSSEMIAAVAGALDTTLLDLVAGVAGDLLPGGGPTRLLSVPVASAASGPAPTGVGVLAMVA